MALCAARTYSYFFQRTDYVAKLEILHFLSNQIALYGKKPDFFLVKTGIVVQLQFTPKKRKKRPRCIARICTIIAVMGAPHLSSPGAQNPVFLAHPRGERFFLLSFPEFRVRAFLLPASRSLGVATPATLAASDISPVVGTKGARISLVLTATRFSGNPLFPVALTRRPAPFFLKWSGNAER